MWRWRSVGVVACSLVLAAAVAPGAARAADVLAAIGFGSNEFGQLAQPANDTPNPVPSPVSLPGSSGTITTVATASLSTLMATSSGQLYSFGGNLFGQLGRTQNDAPNPLPELVTLPGQSGAVTEIALGLGHTLVLTASGQVYAFGLNRSGELGNATNAGTFAPNPVPALVALPDGAGTPVHIAAGAFFSLVATSSGELYSFGSNVAGQLGRPVPEPDPTVPNPTPTLVTLPGQVGTIVAVAGGTFHSLVATSSGQLYSFGANRLGELGRPANSTPNPVPALVTLPGLSAPVRLAAGGGPPFVVLAGHSLVGTADGKLYAFGANNVGQLGVAANSAANPVAAEVPLSGATGAVTQLSAPGPASLVGTSSGQLYAFGSNHRGQLGMATNSGTNTPNPTPALVELPAGMGVDGLGPAPTADHSLVILRNVPLLGGTLPGGQVGVPYAASLQSTNGTAPLSWSASGLPPGLSIDPAAGAITGTPTSEGSFPSTVTVTDARGGVASADHTIAIAAAAPTPDPTPVPPGPPAATPTPVPVPPVPLPLACSGKDIVLLDVHLQSGRVVVGGVALPKYAGQRVTIAPVARGPASLSTTIRPDGTFEAKLKPPARSQRTKVRYSATVAGKKSAALKLVRQFVITSQSRVAGGLRLKARVTGGKRGQTVTLQRQLSCAGGTAVSTAKLSRRGEFSVVLAPPSAPSPLAFYRAITKIGKARTFTLPIAVRAVG